MQIITLCLLAVSAIANAYFLLKKPPNKKLDATAQDLLHELSSGSAILKIDIVSSGDFFIRRR